MTKMKLQVYEATGGFADEMAVINEIGLLVIVLNRKLLSRPSRPQEREAIDKLAAGVEQLRLEISRTRNDDQL